MLYKFKSRASGDLIMLGPQGDRVLALLGREPAPQGIFEARDLPALAARLEAAIAAEAADAADAADAAKAQVPPEQGADAEGPASSVGLRQRLWPMLEMMRRSQAADEPIVWGV
jgi:hypothetical protein